MTPHPSKSGEYESNEPDYRFTLANERTFLAWLRTALALLAAGVVAGRLVVVSGEESTHRFIGIICVVLAMVVGLGGYARWRQVQTAMRRGLPLPSAVLVTAMIAGVCLAGISCLLVLLL